MSLLSRNWFRALAAASAAVVFTVAGGSTASADEPVIDGDAVAPITASGPISFGNVCVGATVTTSRLVAAKRTAEDSQVSWRNNTTLTATASTTGAGATATLPDQSITLPVWSNAAVGTLSGDTAQVTLNVVAAPNPATMSGSLTVTLTGLEKGNGSTSLVRSATVPWTLNAISCNTPPTISVNDVTLEGNTLGGRTLAFADIGTASDAEDAPKPSVTCSPAIADLLPLGTTTVTCTAKDSANLTKSDSGLVTVVDTTKPVVTGTPSSVSAEAASADGVTHSYTGPTASDVVWGTVAVGCAPPPGSTFPLGATTVTCTATDGSGNAATTSFQVNVHDSTAPDFPQPEDVTVEATSSAGALVTFTAPSADDAVSGAVDGTCSPTSGGQFDLGDTTVTCSATDGAQNIGSTSFVVHVVDTKGPDLDVPSDLTREATSANGTEVSYTASATDTVDDDVTVRCTPASGSLFGLGSHKVTCTATDDAGNDSQKSFTVTVRDTTAPVLHGMPGNRTVEGNTTGGALEAYTAPTAADAVDPNPVVECDPPVSSLFALGETTVTCTATDASGNDSSDRFTVTVVDTTAPKLFNVPTDVEVEGNTAGGAHWAYTPPTATDIVDASPTIGCTPPDTAVFPLGETTVTCTASDASGNTSKESSFVITVADTTDPTISWVSTAPVPNENGWNTSEVTVTWSCTDIVGVQSPTVTAVVSTEGAGQSASGTCTDTSGNTASDTVAGINLDKSGPTAELAVSAGTLGGNGWYVSNVTVRTTGEELLSGPATCSADQHLDSDSLGTTFAGSCTNQAGLTTNAVPLKVKRDTVAPTITDAGVDSGTAGNGGWYTSAVTNRFTADDETSGVVPGMTGFTRGSGGAEGSAVRISSGAVKDNAGNESAPIDSAPYKIDLSDPTGLVFVGGPAVGSSHYFGQVPAAPTCTASDAVSGISSCTVTGYSTDVGAHTLTATATDNAGRATSVTRNYAVLGWTAKGFYQPVDMGGVLNTVKAGSTVPLKFELFAGDTEQTTTSAVKSFKVASVNCSALGTGVEDGIELTTTGGTSLRYDTTGGQFVQNWQTPKTAGACYRVTMTALDGSYISANFKLK